MKFLKFIFLIFPLFLNINLFAQNNTIDSLIIISKNNKNDSVKIEAIIKILQELSDLNSDTITRYWDNNQAYIKSKGTYKQNALSNRILGFYYRLTGNYKTALNLFFNNLLLAKNNNDTVRIASSNGNIGNCYYDLGENQKAIDYYNKALNIFEKINNINGLASVYGVIGNVYISIEQYENAIINYKKAKKFFKKLNSEFGIATCDMNIGIAYKNLEKYNEALTYFKNAEDNYTKLQYDAGLASIYGNKGNTYSHLGEYKKALSYQKKCLEATNKVGMKKNMTLCLNDIAKCYIDLNKPDKAIEFSLSSLDSCKKYSFSNMKAAIFNNLYFASKKKKDYKSALIYFEKYKKFSDSIFLNEKENNINKLLTEFETKEKNKEIEILNKDKKLRDETINHQKQILTYLIIGIFIFVILSILLLRMFIQKKKANKALTFKNNEVNQQKEEIETQKNEITKQKKLVEKQHRKINDSIEYASNIQNAILPPNKFISKIIQNNFILFKPKDIVSGDFYWFAEKNNAIYFAAADCTGHGVPGAFMSMLGISFLNNIISSTNKDLSASEILDILKLKIIEALHQTDKKQEATDGIDIAICKINSERNLLEYSGAFNPLFILRNNEILTFEADNMPIGIYDFKKMTKKFTNNIINLEKGDLIYTFSDGYIDQFGGKKGKKFMIERFKKTLLEIQNLEMEKQKQYLSNTIKSWMGNYEQIDDILVMGIKI